MSLKLLSFLIVLAAVSAPLQAKEAKCTQANCFGTHKAIETQASPEVVILERVIDGDTFVASGRKIRLWGVDTPEKDEVGYKTATWFLEALLKEDEIKCQFISKDKYKRDVMRCYVDGIDVGSELVKFGMAKDYIHYSRGYYQTQEKEAKSAKKGIWAIGNKSSGN